MFEYVEFNVEYISEYKEMNRQMNLRAETWQRSQRHSNFRPRPKHGRQPVFKYVYTFYLFFILLN